jgi:hypothetical protein
MAGERSSRNGAWRRSSGGRFWCAQIALGVIIGGLTIALLATGFLVWNSRQRNERLAIGLFIAGAVIVVVLVVVVGQ